MKLQLFNIEMKDNGGGIIGRKGNLKKDKE